MGLFGFEGDDAREKVVVLLTMCFALAMVMIDNTVVNVALPTLNRELGASISDLQWIVDGYVLAFASLLLTGGILGDRYGRKRTFLTGLAVFTLSSLACALSADSTQLIGARAVQGIGAALLMPGTLSILTVTFPPRERAKAIGLWAGVSGLALALGPTLGGYMVEHLGWESVFFLNVPIGIVAFAVAVRTVRESRSDEARRLDIGGLLLGTGSLFAFTYALIEANQLGWSDPRIVGGPRAGCAARPRVPRVGAPHDPPDVAARVLPHPGLHRGQHRGVLGLARHVRDVLLPQPVHAEPVPARLHRVRDRAAVPADDLDDRRHRPLRGPIRLEARVPGADDLRVDPRGRWAHRALASHARHAVLGHGRAVHDHGPRHGARRWRR